VFSSQLGLGLEGGVRLSPHLALGLYLDHGVGDGGSDLADGCNAEGIDCDAQITRVGLLLRHTFEPFARTTPWLSIGTGYERGSVHESGGGLRILTYEGWEALRLMLGVDVRSSGALGVGFYAGVSFGRYGHVEDRFESVDLDRQPFHTTFQGGIRFTLFP
jgi:hypothetical protein